MKWSGLVDKSRYSDFSAYVMTGTNISDWNANSRTYLEFTHLQTECAVMALDAFCRQHNVGISSSDLGFYK